MAFPSYHLWLKPSRELFDALSETIQRLARQLGGPAFPPHITLLGSVSGSEQQHRVRVETLAMQLRPFDVVLDQPRFGTTYFESIFMQVQASEQLLTANALARRIFGTADQVYRPHLSIVYGEYAEQRKQEVIPELTAFVNRSFRVDRVYLIEALSRDPADWREMTGAVIPAGATRD